MAARGWAAVLLLTAVFLGHGLQCGSGAGDAAHAGGASIALTADAHLAGPAAVYGTVGATTAAPAAHVVDATVAPGGTVAHIPGHWHGQPGHLWAVCLAVLAAGLAVLLAVLTPRLIGLASSAAARLGRRGAFWPALLRPPDLFSLCIQRI